MNNIFGDISNVPLLKILLIFYVLVSNSALQPLMSKQWNTMMEGNRIMKHIIGLVTMITLVTLASDGKIDNMAI